MKHSLALTGIALIAASVVTGCRGGHAGTLADPVVPPGHIGQVNPPRPGHIRHRREFLPRGPVVRHRRALRPGCKRVAGGMQCVSTRGLDRDWLITNGDDQDPTRSLIDPKSS